MQLNGLVLCGGKSSRMGEDKSLISYHGAPQYLQSYNLLSRFCTNVYISCRSSQVSNYAPLPCIIDKNESQGPLEGIRNAFAFNPSAWLIMPCDMPLIGEYEINQLINGRNAEIDTVCFEDYSGVINPLFGIWEQNCGELLKEYEGDSPKEFLKGVKVNLFQTEAHVLINVNDENERKLLTKALDGK